MAPIGADAQDIGDPIVQRRLSSTASFHFCSLARVVLLGPNSWVSDVSKRCPEAFLTGPSVRSDVDHAAQQLETHAQGRAVAQVDDDGALVEAHDDARAGVQVLVLERPL